MRVWPIHYLVVGELEDGFCYGKLIANFLELWKVQSFSQLLNKPLTKLKNTVEGVLVEYLRLLHEVHENCLSLATEGNCISRRVG